MGGFLDIKLSLARNVIHFKQPSVIHGLFRAFAYYQINYS